MSDKSTAAIMGLVAASPILILTTYILSLPNEIRNEHFSFMVLAPLSLASLPWGFAIAPILSLLQNRFSENIVENVVYVWLVLSIYANCYWIAYNSGWRKTLLFLFSVIFSMPLIAFLDHLHKF